MATVVMRRGPSVGGSCRPAVCVAAAGAACGSVGGSRRAACRGRGRTCGASTRPSRTRRGRRSWRRCRCRPRARGAPRRSRAPATYARRGRAELGREAPQEVALAHRDTGGEDGEAVVGAGLGLDQLLGAADRLVVGTVAPDRCGELALRAGPAQEHHEPAGARLGDVGTVVVLDEGERHVDAGGDAGRRPHVAVAGPDRIGVDVDVGVLGGEALGAGPVGRRPPAVEETGGGEQERAAADTDDAPGAGGEVGDRGDEVGVVAGPVAGAVPAGHEQRVDRPAAVDVRRDELQAALGRHGSGLERHDVDLVAGRPRPPPDEPAGAGEHLVGAGDVERLHVGVGDDHDAAGSGHGSTVGRALDGVKDAHPTNPASTRSGTDASRSGRLMRRVLSGGSTGGPRDPARGSTREDR